MPKVAVFSLENGVYNHVLIDIILKPLIVMLIFKKDSQMYSVTMPHSQYTLDIDFKPIEPLKQNGQFLDVSNPDLYYEHVVKTLQHQGQSMQKTASIFAWPLGVAQEWATKDISGEAETVKSVGQYDVSENERTNAKNELFLVFSSHEFNYKTALQTYMMAHTMAGIAKSALPFDDLSALQKGQLRYTLNTSAYGMWTMDAHSLKTKYDTLNDDRFPDVYVPKPEATRIIAPVQVSGYDGIEMPTSWGSFKIRNGGHIAIAVTEEDKDPTGYQQFVRNNEMLTKMDNPDVAQLFLVNKEDGVRSVLDIYGIEPGFVQSNYKKTIS
jgi:hypothetical protein